MNTVVRCLGFDEFNLAVKSLDECWGSGHILARNPQMFDWMFKRDSLWDRSEYSFAVAFADDQPIGQLGGVPFHYNQFGKSSIGIWTANWSVKPEARKGPVAIQLMLEFQRRAIDLVMLFGMNPMLHPIMAGLKYHTVDSIPRFWTVFENGLDRFKTLVATAYPDWSPDRLTALADRFVLRSKPHQSPEFSRQIPDSWDVASWQSIAGTTIGAARTAAFLRWRYADHPVYDYRFVVAEHSDGAGLAVWRREEIEASGTRDLGSLGRIMEFLAPTASCADQLAACLLADMNTSDVFGADFLGYNGASGGALQRAGFRAAEQETDGNYIPCRFQPIDTEMTTLNSAISVIGQGPDAAFSPNCQWLWTKGDGDMDRP